MSENMDNVSAGRRARRLSRKSIGGQDKENVEDEVMAENNDALEKRKRRRQSRLIQQRRKSLTPATKKKQYITEMYSTIIQMSSENKINQKNTWALPLIDHMDDILQQKPDNEGQEDLTYNFQKASCTLDASVKIYSHRVDDTWNSSFKILENLTRSDSGKETPGASASETNTSKRFGVVDTLEKNVNNITLKTFDQNFQVDPLFQKMSKVFDEGGAKGMLLVNLNVTNGCQLAFDSSDIVSVQVEESDEDMMVLDVSDLASKLHEDVESLEICPKIRSYYNNMQSLSGKEVDESIEDRDDDSFDNEPLPDDDFNFLDDEREADRQENDLHEQLNQDDEEAPVQLDTMMSFDLDSSFSRLEVVLKDSVATMGSNEYSYFNPQLMSNWAGPKHWQRYVSNKKKTREVSTEKQKKTKKKVELIDFITAPAVEMAEIAKNVKTLQLSENMIEKLMKTADELVYPVDTHYTTSDLYSLFLKPRSKLHVHSNEKSNEGEGRKEEHETYDDFDNDHNHDDSLDDSPMDFLDDDFAALNLVEAERKVEQIDIRYETVAKRVDVKALKKNIWDHVEHVTPSSTADDNGLHFDSVLQDIADKVPSNVTVSFYFICMLHLANEKGLELVGHEDLSNFTIKTNPN